MPKKDPTERKLIFSNPAQPNSDFTPEMKNASEVKAFDTHQSPARAGLKSDALPKVAVYTVQEDITVTPSNPLIVNGSGPVEVNYGTVTIEPGGQIQVFTPAVINIQTLIKQ